VVDNVHFKNGALDDTTINFISTVINYVVNNNKITEFINDYTNKSYDDLWDRRQEYGFDENRYENQSHTYDVVGPFTINGFENAKEYGDQSAKGSKICYTQKEYTWKRYLDNGNNVLYIFLRDDWESVSQVHTDCTIFPDHPEWDGYDDYGLSMLFVIINPITGKLKYCNTRWNHGGKYKPEFDSNVDNVLTIDELKQIVGEKLINQIITINEEFTEMEFIGNGLYIVKNENGCNIYNKKRKSLVIVNADNQPVWFKYIKQINNSCFQVENNERLKSVLILDGNGGYKFVTDDKTDKVLYFRELSFLSRNHIFVTNDEGFGTLLIINGIGEYNFLTDYKTGDTLWFKNLFSINEFDFLIGKEDKNSYYLLISVDKDNGIYRFLTDYKTGDILRFNTISLSSIGIDYFNVKNDKGLWSLLIPVDKDNGGYKLITDETDEPIWFENIYPVDKGCLNIEYYTGMCKVSRYLIPLDENNGIYKVITWDEYKQYITQQYQPLNEIINRLVRNYRR
jgi:hypothetical protein